MFKLIALLAFVAVAAAGPALLSTPLLAKLDSSDAPADTEHAAHVVAPLAPLAISPFTPLLYRSPYAPLTYSAPQYFAAGPQYIGAAQLAYGAGLRVAYSAEPIEQHGYKIAY